MRREAVLLAMLTVLALGAIAPARPAIAFEGPRAWIPGSASTGT